MGRIDIGIDIEIEIDIDVIGMRVRVRDWIDGTMKQMRSIGNVLIIHESIQTGTHGT